jgi:hypothetical protein
MNGLDAKAFGALFMEACQKCFGHGISGPLSETESRQLSAQIFDQTGLVVGAKSIKNYSSFILKSPDSKEENPSVATMDTLARYVLDAPYTDETARKNKEGHFPYWFRYKEQFYRNSSEPHKQPKRGAVVIGLILLVLVAIAVIGFLLLRNNPGKPFVEEFLSTAEDSLASHGWLVQKKDNAFWKRRDENPGNLTLFTLRGDNWPDSVSGIPGINNFLVRKVTTDCFTAEIRMEDFFPRHNWQQTGILLMEDTSFTGRSVRFSLIYNDYFGGFKGKPAIALQAITSQGKGSKPEEVIHQNLFELDSSQLNLIGQNLKWSGLRMEMSRNRIRFLFSCSPINSFAFKVAATHDFVMQPKYIGIFAIRGHIQRAPDMPAKIDYFSFIPGKCSE